MPAKNHPRIIQKSLSRTWLSRAIELLNSLDLNQDDQVREELAKTVIHDKNFIHVLIELPPASPATLPTPGSCTPQTGTKLSPKATQERADHPRADPPGPQKMPVRLTGRLHVEDRRRRAKVTDSASLRSRLYSSAAGPHQVGIEASVPGTVSKCKRLVEGPARPVF